MSTLLDGKMDALVLHAVGDLRAERAPVPSPKAGEALIRVAACGVCGSDLPRVYAKGTYSFPLIPGHEFAGTIEAYAPDVEGWSAGDRVAVFPLLWCGKCAACEEGSYAQCSSYDYLGSRSNGAFAEYVCAPAANLARVPDGLSLDEAALCEPAAVALHALRRAGGDLPGKTVAVLGAGPVGLLVAQWARILGAQDVVVLDIDDAKLALAAELGFELRANTRSEDAAAAIARLTGGAGVNVAVDAAGVPATFIAGLRCLQRGGRFVMLGNPSADVTLPAELISQAMRREVALLGTWNSQYRACSRNEWTVALDAMATGRLRVAPLISHRVSIREGVPAFELMRDRKEAFAKVLICPGG